MWRNHNPAAGAADIRTGARVSSRVPDNARPARCGAAARRRRFDAVQQQHHGAAADFLHRLLDQRDAAPDHLRPRLVVESRQGDILRHDQASALQGADDIQQHESVAGDQGIGPAGAASSPPAGHPHRRAVLDIGGAHGQPQTLHRRLSPGAAPRRWRTRAEQAWGSADIPGDADARPTPPTRRHCPAPRIVQLALLRPVDHHYRKTAPHAPDLLAVRRVGAQMAPSTRLLPSAASTSLPFGILVGIAENHPQAARIGQILDTAADGREERIADVGDDQADGIAVARAQAPGRQVGQVAGAPDGSSTRLRISGSMALPASARDTAAGDTPAALATSLMPTSLENVS